jgi:hypothetical protein
MMEVQDTRFWRKVDHLGDCWKWTGARNADGYGNLTRYPRHLRAHRYAWELATGETLARHDTICHTCDTPSCVRNDDEGTYRVGSNIYPRRGHLYKATQPANVADRDTKGRGHWATGEQHGTRLHPEAVPRGDEQVRQIRATYTGRYGELTALARRFNTTATAVQRAAQGQTWAHVDGEAEALVLSAPAPKARGERHSQAKLTEAQVREIRRRVMDGEVQRRLAAEYGVNVATICNIVSGKIWAYVI